MHMFEATICSVGELREKRSVRGPNGVWDLYVSDAENEHAPLRPHWRRPPRAAVSAIHILAVNDWFPGQERLHWTTTETSLERVLQEIEEGFVVGKVVQPVGAFYLGSYDDRRSPSPDGFVVPEIPVAALNSIRCMAMDAYDLVDELPYGSARGAAWCAYALQTYGDKLLAAGDEPDFVPQDTAEMAGRLFELAARWLEHSHRLAEDPASRVGEPPERRLPTWRTLTRSQDQLAGMRETLDTLRTHIAHQLAQLPANLSEHRLATLREQLAEVDGRWEESALLWIPRQPADLRRGIGTALSNGLAKAYALGHTLASTSPDTRRA